MTKRENESTDNFVMYETGMLIWKTHTKSKHTNARYFDHSVRCYIQLGGIFFKS